MDNLLAQYMMQQQPINAQNTAAPQEQYNPFNSGIRRAIQSARESLTMTREQEEAALRNSLLAFGAHIGQEPARKGFWNNFGAAARGLAPAIEAYDNSEQQAMQQNQALAQQLIGYRQQEEAKLAQEEERKWRRKMAEDQLAEQKRYHDLMHETKLHKKKGDLSNRVDLDKNGLVEGKYVPFQTPKERMEYTKTFKGSNSVISAAKRLEDAITKFQDKYKDNVVNPFAPLGIGTGANYIKTHYAHFADNAKLKEETDDRARLQSQIGIFITKFDRAEKGGILTQNVMDTLARIGAVPNEDDPPHILSAKLKGIVDTIAPMQQEAKNSLLLNAHVYDDPFDSEQQTQENNLPQMLQAEEKIPQASQEQGFVIEEDGRVLMTDDTGEVRKVKPENVPARLEAGARLVR